MARADAWTPCPACTDQATWLVRLSLDTGAVDTLTPAAGQHVSVPRLTPDGNTIHSPAARCSDVYPDPRRGSPLLPGQRDRDHRARRPRPHRPQHCQRSPGDIATVTLSHLLLCHTQHCICYTVCHTVYTQALVLHSLAEGGGVAVLAGAELGIHPDRVKPWPHRMFVNVRILPCICRCFCRYFPC